MLRSVGAVVAGYVVMVVLVMTGTMAWVATMVPGGLAAMRQNPQASSMTPTPRYLAMNIALSLVAAMAAGWVTLRIADRSPRGHLLALAAVVLVMGVVSTFMPNSERQPQWYKYAIPVVGLAGIALSALLTVR
jgi:hypothetical protein